MGSERDRDPVLRKGTIIFCNVYKKECNRLFCKANKRCGLGSDSGYSEITKTEENANIQKDR